ncbi:MAG: DNA-protecting protein DprA [Myxococcales bacterium]|nr:DNA-protecting protein DprA [Myxococcales bacterium]
MPGESAEHKAMLGLWAVPGIGPRAVASIEARVGLVQALTSPVSDWLGSLPLTPLARTGLLRARTIGEVADRALERARRAGMGIVYRGDAAYPALLAEIRDAPPLLFHFGMPGGPRRRLAMVGTRTPDGTFAEWAQRFAAQIAHSGVGVVSGAAEGIDRACHLGAVDAQGETWAFAGSALDELDPGPKSLLRPILDSGGVFFSEFPPGVRADRTTFPRRNRLISGASDAVLVLRAGPKSGTLYTSDYAREQGRPVLAVPGEARYEKAFGCNDLIRKGHARLCMEPADALAAVGAWGHLSAAPPPARPVDMASLSSEAQAAYAALERTPLDFEDVLTRSKVESGALTSALCELELSGLIVQRPGRRYEKV